MHWTKNAILLLCKKSHVIKPIDWVFYYKTNQNIMVFK